VQVRHALKGHPICGDESLQIDRSVPKQPHSGAAFRALLSVMSDPGLKPWAAICNRFAVIRRQPARRSLRTTGRSRDDEAGNKTKKRIKPPL
jgi:hypothetical protein